MHIFGSLKLMEQTKWPLENFNWKRAHIKLQRNKFKTESWTMGRNNYPKTCTTVMHQKLFGFYLGGQFEVIKFALLTCLHITLLHWSHTSLTLKKITETTALSPDKELQASTDKNSNLQGSGGLNRFFFWWNLEISVSLNSI